MFWCSSKVTSGNVMTRDALRKFPVKSLPVVIPLLFCNLINKSLQVHCIVLINKRCPTCSASKQPSPFPLHFQCRKAWSRLSPCVPRIQPFIKRNVFLGHHHGQLDNMDICPPVFQGHHLFVFLGHHPPTHLFTEWSANFLAARLRSLDPFQKSCQAQWMSCKAKQMNLLKKENYHKKLHLWTWLILVSSSSLSLSTLRIRSFSRSLSLSMSKALSLV